MFEEAFPMYLSFGMTPEMYWEGDPWLVRDYLYARNIATERMNREAWLHGFYVHNAVAVVLQNALSKKGARPQKYMEPLRITPMTEVEKQRKVEEDRKRAIEHFTRLGEHFKAKQECIKEVAHGNN